MSNNTVRITIKFFCVSCLFLLVRLLPAQQKIDPPAAPVSAAPLWEQDLGDTVTGTPFLQVNSAVLVGGGGGVKSYFMTGTALWNFDPRERAVPFIARSIEGVTYVCNSAGSFMAVNRVGRELWRVDLGRPISFSPVIGWDGRVFIPVESGMSCRTASGRSLWTRDLGSPMTVAPVLDHAGSVVTALRNQDFVRVTQFGVVERIKLDRLPALIVSLKDGDQQSYALLYSSGEMEKVIFNDSAPAGRKLSRARLASLPAAAAAANGRDDRFAVVLRDGRVLCLNSAGSVLWTKNSHEAAGEQGAANLALEQASVLFDERGIYAITARGITAFAADGRRRFIFKYTAEASGIPALSDEGLLYVCGKDNRLRVYKPDGKARTAPRSKYYGIDPEGSYGMGSPPPSPWAADGKRYEDDRQNAMYTTIEQAIRSGQLGEHESEYTAYLMEMIGFFLNDPHYSPVRPAVKPPQRVKFVKLLGQIGSRETIPFLWRIFDRDPEPAVRIACAEAIGTIGVDPTGRSLVSYNFLLSPNNPNQDQQLLLAATASIAALCRYSGPPLSPDGLRILRYFTNLTWPSNNVKTQIQNEINALRIEGLDVVLQ